MLKCGSTWYGISKSTLERAEVRDRPIECVRWQPREARCSNRARSWLASALSERGSPSVSLETLRVFKPLRVLGVAAFPTSDLSTESRSVNPYKLHSPSTLVGGEQNRPANPWRHDAKHVSPHLTWQIIPPQRASQTVRRKPSVSEMTSVRFSQSQCYACVLYASAKFVGGTNGILLLVGQTQGQFHVDGNRNRPSRTEVRDFDGQGSRFALKLITARIRILIAKSDTG